MEAMAECREDQEREVGDASVIADNEKFRRLSQEYAQLGPLAENYVAHRDATHALADLEAMQRDNDPEMRAMADAEWPEVRARIDALEAELQGYLVPKDPLDNNNVFLEIRAGTGGDEAAIFAGDLHRIDRKSTRL